MATLLGWHSGADGPSVLMPIEVVPLWEGIEPPSNGRIVEAEFRWDDKAEACDYDRACDASDHFCGELFPFGASAAYVPAGGQQIALFASDDPKQQLILELWAHDEEESDEALLQRAFRDMSAIDAAEWKILGEMECPSGEVWVFHAADAGSEMLIGQGGDLETPFSFTLEPGTYRFLYADWPNPKWPDGKDGLIWLRRKDS